MTDQQQPNDAINADASHNETIKITTPTPTTKVTNEIDQNELKQRRKDKIMSSREDRLAKILSMASGRTVDPKEIHLERTPSPTVSEKAAAGVGTVNYLDTDSLTNLSSNVSVGSSTKEASLTKMTPRNELYHTIVIILSAIFFCIWYLVVFLVKDVSNDNSSTFSPWQIMLATFLCVESIEMYANRLVNPFAVFKDASLFLFSIVFIMKIFG